MQKVNDFLYAVQSVVTLSAIYEARRVITSHAIRTPLVRLNPARLNNESQPAEIYLKLENLQPIGSFKIRGAANAIARLAPELLERGVVTASAGNMAQGAAWCARELRVSCTEMAPSSAPVVKVFAVERLGGREIKISFDEGR